MFYEVTPEKRKYVAVWLFVVAAFVFAMIAVGGLTRLTGSGLSMTDWKPILGAVPPLNEADWLSRLEQYRASPEYKQINRGMSMEEFKFIFYMEYGHRLLGRMVGLVFFFPFLFFWIKNWMGPQMIKRGILLFILGGLQGLMGWYMVQSGLVDEPRVSQYRLTAHFSLAMLIFSLALWFGFKLMRDGAPAEPRQLSHRIRQRTFWLMVLVGLQIITGCFVAGLDAGFASSTWPKMNGAWVPEGMLAFSPWFSNFFENPVTVQWTHRTMAYVVAILVLTYYVYHVRRFRGTPIGIALHIMAALLVAQVILGIVTIINLVPVPLASAHQLTAVALWTSLLFIARRVYLPTAAWNS